MLHDPGSHARVPRCSQFRVESSDVALDSIREARLTLRSFALALAWLNASIFSFSLLTTCRSLICRTLRLLGITGECVSLRQACAGSLGLGTWRQRRPNVASLAPAKKANGNNFTPATTCGLCNNQAPPERVRLFAEEAAGWDVSSIPVRIDRRTPDR